MAVVDDDDIRSGVERCKLLRDRILAIGFAQVLKDLFPLDTLHSLEHCLRAPVPTHIVLGILSVLARLMVQLDVRDRIDEVLPPYLRQGQDR